MNTCSKCGIEIPDGYGELCTKCFSSREGSRSDVRISDVVGRERERTATTEADSCAVGREESDSARLRMSGQNAREIIINCHALLRNKFRGSPLWSLVGHITGHGSGYSHDICKSANLNPEQECGKKTLEDLAPTLASATASERLTPNSVISDPSAK